MSKSWPPTPTAVTWYQIVRTTSWWPSNRWPTTTLCLHDFASFHWHCRFGFPATCVSADLIISHILTWFLLQISLCEFFMANPPQKASKKDGLPLQLSSHPWSRAAGRPQPILHQGPASSVSITIPLTAMAMPQSKWADSLVHHSGHQGFQLSNSQKHLMNGKWAWEILRVCKGPTKGNTSNVCPLLNFWDGIVELGRCLWNYLDNLFHAHVVKLPSFGQKTAMQGHLCCKERMKVLL